ncbi:hypothetical protein RFI_39883, partial [Reticulomyxa filosa]
INTQKKDFTLSGAQYCDPNITLSGHNDIGEMQSSFGPLCLHLQAPTYTVHKPQTRDNIFIAETKKKKRKITWKQYIIDVDLMMELFVNVHDIVDRECIDVIVVSELEQCVNASELAGVQGNVDLALTA